MKYYLHDTSSFDDEKITELYLKFGYEGLGLFYTLLEKIARQEKPIKTEVLKAQLNVGKHLNKCWKFMEEIGLISSTNGDTFNERLLNFSESYEIKKEKTRKKVSEWREKQRNTNNVTSYETVSNPSKVKESKVKDIKENLIKENSLDPEKLKEEGYVFYKNEWVLLGALTYQQQQEIILGDPIDPNDPNPYSPLDPKTQAFYDRLDERERKEAEEEAEIKKMQDAMR